MTLEDIEKEGIVSIKEWETGVYVIQTEKGWDKLKEDVSSGKVWGGWVNFVPDWVKELNKKHADEIRKYNPNIDKML